MATKAKSKATRTAVSKTAKTKAAKGGKRGFADEAKIKVVGDNHCREGSRHYKGYELMRKTPTVGDFRKKFKPSGVETAGEILRATVAHGYAKIG